MEVLLGDKLFQVEIIIKNNKNIYFRFKDDVLYVTCNRWVRKVDIERIIKDNEKSLLRMYDKVKRKESNQIGTKYLGKNIVKIYDVGIKKPYIEDNLLYIKDDKQFIKWEKEECSRIFLDRINALLPLFDNIPKFDVRLRKMSSRWGVNNVTKNIITLNTELLKKDISLIDYVIIHELCHFYEHNHSDRFWYQVGLRYPNYKLARKRLREE